MLEVRTKVRLYHDLIDERSSWQHRIAATLFHLGADKQEKLLLGDRTRLHASTALTPAGRDAIETALQMIETLDGEVEQLRAELVASSTRQAGCVELAKEFGIGPLTAVTVWSELGDTRRFSSSDDAVRHTGLDITVYSSDGRRTRGHHPARLHPAEVGDVRSSPACV